MERLMKKTFIAFVFLGIFAGGCRAEDLSGDRAVEYINGFSRKMSSRLYAALILQRRNRSTKTGGMIDAIVFLPLNQAYPANNKCRFIRRLDADYVVRLYVPQGTPLSPVTQKDIADYEKKIKDNMLEPYVVLDSKGGEVMIVYCALNPCSIELSPEKEGAILLQLYRTFKDDEFQEPNVIGFPENNR